MELVDEVLRRLEERNVVVKSSKAQFGMESIECLGFIVGTDGVRPDPEKVEAIQKFPRPQTQKQLRGFLGLLNFYGWMVPNLQKVVKPLNKATGEDSKLLQWTPSMEEAFEGAKALFAAQVLTVLPDFSKPFVHPRRDSVRCCPRWATTVRIDRLRSSPKDWTTQRLRRTWRIW